MSTERNAAESGPVAGVDSTSDNGQPCSAGPSEKSVVMEYFALFKEQRGLATETVSTTARTLKELYRELADAYGLRYDPESVSVARNDEFAAWDDRLSEGDRVVFLSPFGGG